MGWDFRGLYTVDTAATRARLTADEVVRGLWAEIPASAAPDAALPEPGLLVVHGFSPSGDDVPWDVFWPAGPVASEMPLHHLYVAHRPPRNLLAWMREFTAAVGVPIALYECLMFAGDIEAETAVICDGATTTVPQTSPLLAMLRALGGRPRQWVFPPHERPFPSPLHLPAAYLARHSPMLAIRGDDPAAVDDLLTRGADLDESSLCDAAEHGNPAIVERLLRAGAPIGAGPHNPLGHAANPACARLLLAAGAPLGDTLRPVTWRGFGETARFLIDQGAPVDVVDLWEPAAQGGVTFLLERALAAGAPVDRARALVVGALYGRDAVVELMLHAGEPASDSAVDSAASGGHTDMLRMLLAHGGDPTGGGADYPPLFRAAYDGHHDAVLLLLAAGADPGAPCAGGVPLHAACWSGRVALVELFLNARPDLVNARPGLYPPLREALANGSPEVIALLLAHGADPDGTDEFGQSMREYATWRGITLP